MNPANQLAEQGMALVIRHQSPDWLDQASSFIVEHLRVYGPATMDECRAYLEEVEYLDRPSHANAWGALTRTLHKQGLIERTGEWRQSVRVASHARMAPVWRAV